MTNIQDHCTRALEIAQRQHGIAYGLSEQLTAFERQRAGVEAQMEALCKQACSLTENVVSTVEGASLAALNGLLTLLERRIAHAREATRRFTECACSACSAACSTVLFGLEVAQREASKKDPATRDEIARLMASLQALPEEIQSPQTWSALQYMTQALPLIPPLNFEEAVKAATTVQN